MLKLKKKDTVIVIKGKDRWKKGEIKEIVHGKDSVKVVVMGINIVSKHKPNHHSCLNHDADYCH